jgi:hypothetical protein
MSRNENEESSVGMQYFRTPVLGLSVVIGDPDPTKGIIAPKTLRFEAFEIQQSLGEPLRVAYLATDNGRAIAKLANDPNVVTVKREEYEKYTNLESDEPKIKRARI